MKLTPAKIKGLSAAMLAAGMLFSATASSSTVTLESLLSGGSLVVGDKTFSNFTFSETGTGSPASAADINVTTLDTVNYGLQFSSGFFASAGNTLDVLLGFDVTSTAPNLISDVHGLFNGSVTGDGFTNVVESVTNLAAAYGTVGDSLAQITIKTPSPLDAAANLAYNTTEIHVLKDILLNGGTAGTNSNASISVIEQRFSQTTTVPEPSTLALMGVALAGFGYARRRKQG